MNNQTDIKSTKASEIIKTSCCSVLLDVPKCQLVDMVKQIELDNEWLVAENRSLEKSRFVAYLYVWLMLSCFYIWIFV